MAFICCVSIWHLWVALWNVPPVPHERTVSLQLCTLNSSASTAVLIIMMKSVGSHAQVFNTESLGVARRQGRAISVRYMYIICIHMV